MILMKNGSVTPLTLLVAHVLTENMCRVGSNQPEYLYSLKKVLKTPDLCHVDNRKIIPYVVNTHTCLQTFLDMCTHDSFSRGIHVIEAFGRITTRNTAVLTGYCQDENILQQFHERCV
jgi:hypothetical protein